MMIRVGKDKDKQCYGYHIYESELFQLNLAGLVLAGMIRPGDKNPKDRDEQNSNVFEVEKKYDFRATRGRYLKQITCCIYHICKHKS